MTDINYTEFKSFINNNIKNIDIIKKSYLNLLSKLTVIEELTTKKFLEQIDNINKMGMIYIAYIGLEIIGTGTIIIEPKIIRNAMSVGHIEDIVVDEKWRNRGISSQLLNLLKAYGFNKNCYKIILDCDSKVVPVYINNGFEEKGVQMSIYK
jgi:glucosamine-phosphate N-acetyltransferase